MEEPGGNFAEDEVTQEVVDENQLDLYQLMAYRSSIHDAMGVIPAKLVVEQKTHIPGNLMFGSHETEFEEQENYPSQVVHLDRLAKCYFRDGLQGDRLKEGAVLRPVSYTHLDVYKRQQQVKMTHT